MTTSPAVGRYVIDPSHTDVGFSLRHAGISRVRGQFTEFSGEIVITEPFSESQVNVEIQSASVNTRDENRDNHLRSPDFWDAENKPTWTFKSTRIEGSGAEFIVHGDLTINGVTKPVALDVKYNGAATDPFGAARVGFSAQTEISRKDFDLTWNAAMETGGFLVGDKVRIGLEISATTAE